MTPRSLVFIFKPCGKVDYAAMAAVANRAANKQRAKAMRDDKAARAASAMQGLRSQVQPAFRPPPGKLWKVDDAAMLIVGPAGGIGTTPVMARTLQALAASGRHDEAAVAAATGWRDVAHLREALDGLAPKLSVLGLRIDRRKAGIRVTKARPPKV